MAESSTTSLALFRVGTYDSDLALLRTMLTERISALPVGDRHAAALDEMILQINALQSRVRPAIAEYRSHLTGVLDSIEELCDRFGDALEDVHAPADAPTLRAAQRFFSSLAMQIESGRIEHVQSPEDLIAVASSRFQFKAHSVSARLIAAVVDLMRSSQHLAALARGELAEALDRVAFLLSEEGRPEERAEDLEEAEDEDTGMEERSWWQELSDEDDVYLEQ